MTESFRSVPKYVANPGPCAEAAVASAQLERTAIAIRQTSRMAAGLADTGSLFERPAGGWIASPAVFLNTDSWAEWNKGTATAGRPPLRPGVVKKVFQKGV